MKVRAIRVGLTLLGNAIGLWLAAIFLGDSMDLSGLAFLLAVAIFTVVVLLLDPLVSRVTGRYIDVLSGGSALISTALALLLTDWISDGLSIDGVGNWLLAAVIVWLSAAILGVVLAKVFIKQATG